MNNHYTTALMSLEKARVDQAKQSAKDKMTSQPMYLKKASCAFCHAPNSVFVKNQICDKCIEKQMLPPYE